MNTATSKSSTEMTRQELVQELEAQQQRMRSVLLRLHSVSMSLHEMTEALTSVLVPHIESRPVDVYSQLNALAARYVRSSLNGQTLSELTAVAGKVH